MLGSRKITGATSMPATDADQGREPPAEREHPADADAAEPARARVLRGRAHGEAECRVAEEDVEEAEHDERHPDDAEIVLAEHDPLPIRIGALGNGLGKGWMTYE